MNRRSLAQNMVSATRVALTQDGISPEDVRIAIYSALAVVEDYEGLNPAQNCPVAPSVIDWQTNGVETCTVLPFSQPESPREQSYG